MGKHLLTLAGVCLSVAVQTLPATASMTYIYPVGSGGQSAQTGQSGQGNPSHSGSASAPSKYANYRLVGTGRDALRGKSGAKIKAFGRDLPLFDVVRAALPKGWSIYATKDVDWNRLVSFSADSSWTSIIQSVLAQAGMNGVVDWDRKQLLVSAVTKAIKPSTLVPRYVLRPGYSLSSEFIRWGNTTKFGPGPDDHWTVIWQLKNDYPVAYGDYGTDFIGAVTKSIKALRAEGIHIRAKAWANHVLVIRR